MSMTLYEWAHELSSEGIGNLISAATAIIAIGGLVYQSRATGKQLKLQNFIEYTKRYQEIILNFPENVNEQNFKIDSLDLEVKNITMRYMRAYFDLCYEEYILYKKNFIDDDLWSIWKGGMKVAFSKSAFQQAWLTIRKDTIYEDGFEDFVESLSNNLGGR